MKKITIFSLLFSFTVVLNAANYFVNGSVSASGDGNSWATAFKTIDEAIAAASNQDVIYIAAGEYTKAGEISIAKVLTLKGGYLGNEDINNAIPDPMANKAKIRCNATGHAINLTVISDPGIPSAKHVFDGLYFYNTNAGGTGFGGALYLNAYFNNIDIKNCIFEQNKAGKGGAVYINSTSAASSNVLVDNCKFYENGSTGTTNASSWGGGAIYGTGNATGPKVVNLTIQNSEFIENYTYPEGGAIYLREYINLTTNNVLFRGNKAINSTVTPNAVGGAIYFYRKNTVSLSNTQLYGNTSGNKGNLFFNVASAGSNNISASVSNVVIAGNYAGNNGQSNIHVNNYDATTITFANSIIANNTQNSGSNPLNKDFNNGTATANLNNNYTLTNTILGGVKTASSTVGAIMSTFTNTDYFSQAKIKISDATTALDSALVFVNTSESVSIPHADLLGASVMIKIKDGANAYSVRAVSGTTATVEVVVNVSGTYTLSVPSGFRLVDNADQPVTSLTSAGTYQLTLKADPTSVYPPRLAANSPFIALNKLYNLKSGDMVSVYNIQGVRIMNRIADNATMELPVGVLNIVKVQSGNNIMVIR